jgi:hypothetical protein
MFAAYNGSSIVSDTMHAVDGFYSLRIRTAGSPAALFDTYPIPVNAANTTAVSFWVCSSLLLLPLEATSVRDVEATISLCGDSETIVVNQGTRFYTLELNPHTVTTNEHAP